MARPRKDRQREDEFRSWMQRMLDARPGGTGSEYWLAKNVGEDGSTIRQILCGLRTCSEPTKLKILDLLKASDDVAFRFRSTSREGRGLYVQDTDQCAHHRNLNRGLEHLLRGQWREALAHFNRILKNDRDHLDRADAFYHKAWVFCEQGEGQPCLENCQASLAEISASLNGMPLDSILATLQGSGDSAILSRNSRATTILGGVLGLWAKYLAQQVVYGPQTNTYQQVVSDTLLAYKRARILEEWLGDAQRLCHLLRWHAVVLARTDRQHSEAEVKKLLKRSAEGLDVARKRTDGHIWSATWGLLHFSKVTWA